jgi:hypothetical protein
MKHIVNEKNAKRIVAWLVDDDTGEPVYPATLEWRIDCATTGQTLQDFTATPVTTVTDEVGTVTKYQTTIVVPASLNAIQDRCNRQELKKVLIVANRDLDSEWSTEVEYYVKNKQGRS